MGFHLRGNTMVKELFGWGGLTRAEGWKLFWARLSGRPLDLSRQTGCSVWLVEDVTVHREAAEAVSRAHDELEACLHERFAELASANALNALLEVETIECRQAEARGTI